MYGYIIINEDSLPKEEADRYHAYYCGLCRALGDGHGLCGRLTLSYDLTFLSMLLSGLYEPEEEFGESRCALHPGRPCPWVSTSVEQYVADMSVALAYHRCDDDWRDERKYSALAMKNALAKRYSQVCERWPRQAAAIGHSMQQLLRCEEAQSSDLDEVSGCFGLMMSALFVMKSDEWSVTLREMGYALGKFIYLMDAYDDLERDKKHKRYNPLLALSQQPDYEERIHEILTMLMAQCAGAFERLPVLRNAQVLRNILYSGVWTRYAQIQSQKTACKKKKEQE